MSNPYALGYTHGKTPEELRKAAIGAVQSNVSTATSLVAAGILEGLPDDPFAGEQQSSKILDWTQQNVSTLASAFLTMATNGTPVLPATSNPLALGGGAPTAATATNEQLGADLVAVTGPDRAADGIDFLRELTLALGSGTADAGNILTLVLQLAKLGAARSIVVEYMLKLVEDVELGAETIYAPDPMSDKLDRKTQVEQRQTAALATRQLEDEKQQLTTDINAYHTAITTTFGITDRGPTETVRTFVGRAHAGITPSPSAFDALAMITPVFPRNTGETDQQYTDRINKTLEVMRAISTTVAGNSAVAQGGQTNAEYGTLLGRLAMGGLNARLWTVAFYGANLSLQTGADPTAMPPLAILRQMLDNLNVANPGTISLPALP